MKLKYIFSTKLETYAKYLILTAFLFFAFYIGDYFLNLGNVSPILMFLYWFIIVAFSDQIIDYVIGR